MLYVALSSIAALVVVTISFAGVVRWGLRQQARERERLVDQLCYLTGRPWNDPPSREPDPEPERDWENTWESQAPEQMVA
jgi:hypothetical protein